LDTIESVYLIGRFNISIRYILLHNIAIGYIPFKNNMQIHEIFKATMDRHGIKGKDLAEKAGIGKDHLSQFRNGKKWVSPEVFISLLKGMDEIAPGSRRYFCELLAEEPLSLEEDDNDRRLVKMVENASDEEIEEILLTIGREWKKRLYNPTVSNRYSTNIDNAIAV
jgi:transcriptional regulator with XRE-family HTH domain